MKSLRGRIAFSVALLAVLLVASYWLLRPERAAPRAPEVIAATVNGQPISTSLADYYHRQLFADQSEGDSEANWRKAIALNQCLNQEIVLQQQIQDGTAISDSELESAYKRRQQEVTARGEKWSAYLQNLGLSEADFRRDLYFHESWKKLVDQMATDDRLKMLFECRKQEFDGTQLRVARILLKGSKEFDFNDWQRLRNRLGDIRGEIAFGRLTFAEAAKKFSEAPDADSGGEIGFIGRWGPMSDDFNATAFKLEPGAVSWPTHSFEGLNLITVLEVKPGDLGWEEAKDKLRRFIVGDLMRGILETASVRATTEFSEVYPYLSEETGQLVVPGQPKDPRPGFVAKEGRFRIRLPEHATVEDLSQTGPEGKSKLVYFENVIGEKFYHFSVLSHPQGAVDLKRIPAFLEVIRDGFVSDTGLAGERTAGTLLSSKHLEVHGWPAIEYVFERKERRAKRGEDGAEMATIISYTRIVQVNEQTIHMWVKARPDAVSLQEAQDLWDSFEILDEN